MIKTLGLTVGSAVRKQVFTHQIRENGVSERLVLRNTGLTAFINCLSVRFCQVCMCSVLCMYAYVSTRYVWFVCCICVCFVLCAVCVSFWLMCAGYAWCACVLLPHMSAVYVHVSMSVMCVFSAAYMSV